MTFKDIFEKIAWVVERIVFWFCTFLLLGITAIVCLEILSRNIVGHSFIWVEEISMIMLGWLAYISAAYTVRKKGHVALEFLYKKFPMPARKALFVIFTLGMIAFFAFIFTSGVGNAKMLSRIPLTQTRLPRGLIYSGLPVGCVLMIYFFIVDFVETIFFKQTDSLMAADELATYESVVEKGDAE